jgi:hypothetical protein
MAEWYVFAAGHGIRLNKTAGDVRWDDGLWEFFRDLNDASAMLAL